MNILLRKNYMIGQTIIDKGILPVCLKKKIFEK